MSAQPSKPEPANVLAKLKARIAFLEHAIAQHGHASEQSPAAELLALKHLIKSYEE